MRKNLDTIRTVDSVIAQDVYDELTEKGYRVFFSRITLEDKIGQEYEPYIFAALNSAKIMLAFGTSYDYYNAVWVKNEWSRYIKLMAKDKEKHLIPCYKNIDAYDIPKEFKHLQAQDMGKVGAIQDLIRGISKIIDVSSTKSMNGISAPNSAEGAALTQRGNMALEDEDFEGAASFFERALDSNPADAFAYLGKFLAFHKLSTLKDLEDKVCLLEEDKEFKRAEQFADLKLAKELKDVKDYNQIKIERLRLLDALKKIIVERTVSEAESIVTSTEDGYEKALDLIGFLLENNYISSDRHKSLKKHIESQDFALKFLKSNRNLFTLYEISSAARNQGCVFQSRVLDQMVEAGLIEKHSSLYCFKGVKEEKERLIKEEEERKAREEKQKVAYENAVAKITNEINIEVDNAKNEILQQVEEKKESIRAEMNVRVKEANLEKTKYDEQKSNFERQRASLGLFKGKQKAELTEQINLLIAKINALPTEESIRKEYQTKFVLIDREARTKILDAEKTIKSKYTMPKLEDYLED